MAEETKMTALFGPDDFERWWLAGADRSDLFPDAARQELYENCLYLADAEKRALLQSQSELRAAIDQWADEWNEDRVPADRGR